MADWTFWLADHNGVGLAELTTATGKVLTYARNQPATVEFALSHADDAAYLLLEALRNGTPTLRCYRDGVLRFNGYLAPFSEELEESATLNAVFRGPFGRLLGDGPGRGRFTGEYDAYTDDAGQIAKQLIDATNATSHTGLETPDTGDVPATKARERVYEYANIGESIVELSQLLDGFDFEESYEASGAVLATINIMARQGGESDARFQYGPGTLANVRSVRRETMPPANVVRVFGADGLVGEAEDAVSRERYGDWPLHETASEVDDLTVLTDKANGLLRPNPVTTVAFTPELALDNCPKPWDDFWLGDTVRLHGRRDAFVLDEEVRINTARIVVDDNGHEAVEVEDPTTRGEEAMIRASLAVEVL